MDNEKVAIIYHCLKTKPSSLPRWPWGSKQDPLVFFENCTAGEAPAVRSSCLAPDHRLARLISDDAYRTTPLSVQSLSAFQDTVIFSDKKMKTHANYQGVPQLLWKLSWGWQSKHSYFVTYHIAFHGVQNNEMQKKYNDMHNR